MINFERTKSIKIEKYGVRWYILAYTDDDEKDGEEYLDVFLFASHNYESK